MMKALAKFGRPSDFGTYRMIDIPEPECGDNGYHPGSKGSCYLRGRYEALQSG